MIAVISGDGLLMREGYRRVASSASKHNNKLCWPAESDMRLSPTAKYVFPYRPEARSHAIRLSRITPKMAAFTCYH